jgi:hypothetical protein
MAKRPKSVEVRSYQVGFGDCFLVSFVYAQDDKRHLLIDFGTTGLPNSLKPSTHMPRVAQDIADVCNGDRLTALVATHRHADHISGFGTDGKTGESGKIIRGLRPKVVLQPWTEDPDARTDATKATRTSSRTPKSFTAGLRAKQDVARMIHGFVNGPRSQGLSATLKRELSFIGETNIANKSAIDNLIAMGRAKGARAVWANHGSRSGLERLLPGVKVHVLGPPDLTQTESIRKQRSKDPDEFWHLMAGRAGATENPIASGLTNGSTRRTATIPVEARWFRNRLEHLRGDELLQIVRELDAQMNNTSVILLFEVFGRKLLFPGDAQLENWSYALIEAPDHTATKKLLADVDFYKVGHHGSLNATPKKLLWESFTKRGTKKELTTIMQIALASESDLHNTNKLSAAARTLELCHLVTIVP